MIFKEQEEVEELKRLIVAVVLAAAVAGCGGGKDPAALRGTVVAPAAETAPAAARANETVVGMLEKKRGAFLLRAGEREYVLVPGQCDSEKTRKALESAVGGRVEVKGSIESGLLRVDEAVAVPAESGPAGR